MSVSAPTPAAEPNVTCPPVLERPVASVVTGLDGSMDIKRAAGQIPRRLDRYAGDPVAVEVGHLELQRQRKRFAPLGQFGCHWSTGMYTEPLSQLQRPQVRS